MNQQDINFYREEIETARGSVPHGNGIGFAWEYLEACMNEIERLQTIIKTCDEQLIEGYYGADAEFSKVGEYNIQNVNWVHKTLSQAIEGE